MIRVQKLTQTCESFPSQWEGETDDGRFVYVRYRSGVLQIGVGETLDRAVESAVSINGASPLLLARLGDGLDGHIGYDRLRQMGVGVIEWPA